VNNPAAQKKPVAGGSLHAGFRGIHAAMVTPMTADQEVDYDRLAQFTDYLIGKGVHALTPLGSTGEFYALSPDERERVLRVVLETSAGRATIIPGTNATSTREVVAYSRLAEKLGADAVMLAAPYYSLPTPDELFDHFKAVNDAIGVPIMLYNYPGRTGVDMAPELIARLTESLGNVRYVKESTGEMGRIATLIRLCGDRVGILCGCDTIALQSLVMGAIGWVGGGVNVIPGCHVKLYELAHEQKDYAAARVLYGKMLPLLELLENGGRYTSFIKAACGLMGKGVGIPRQPLGAATPEQKIQLNAALQVCLAQEGAA
jgi:4-hydroxy-tetrahydrodipicolinate synthase